MAKKVYKLKGLQPENFRVICIASHQNHYRLSWALNRVLNIHFRQSDDLVIKHNKANVDQRFSKYTFRTDATPITYHLISNKSEQGFLLKELVNIDYLLKIVGELEDEDFKDIIDKIKNLDIVITAFELKPISNVQSKKLTF
jgi:hypothetical protein